MCHWKCSLFPHVKCLSHITVRIKWHLFACAKDLTHFGSQETIVVIVSSSDSHGDMIWIVSTGKRNLSLFRTSVVQDQVMNSQRGHRLEKASFPGKEGLVLKGPRQARKLTVLGYLSSCSYPTKVFDSTPNSRLASKQVISVNAFVLNPYCASNHRREANKETFQPQGS